MTHDISNLRKNRFPRFQVGLILALAVVILAFRYTADEQFFESNQEYDYEDAVEVEPPRTDHQRRLPPPPPVFDLTEIEPVEDEPLYAEEDIFEEEPIDIKPISIELEGNGKPIELPEPEPEEEIEEPEIDEEKIFAIVEEMPRFPACEASNRSIEEKEKCAEKAMLKFIYDNIKYPTFARDNDIQGTVVVRFVIDEKGNITNPKILRNIGASCGEEAIKVVKMMPRWIPGKQRNKAVKVQYNLPIRFKLQ